MFAQYRERVNLLPLVGLRDEHVRSNDFLIERSGSLSVFYAPFDFVNVDARLMLVGITPGLEQMTRGFAEVRRCLGESMSDEEALRLAKQSASFAGPMRKNLVTMLDQIGIPESLGVASSADLFGSHARLLHSTSVLRYPVFKNGVNYSGSPSPTKTPMLRRYIEKYLAEEVRLVSEAVIIPLGKAASDSLKVLAANGQIDERRCLWGFLHPSGANQGRIANEFPLVRDRLRQSVVAWVRR